MKKFFKIILWTIIIVGLPLAGYWAYLHYFYKENQIKVLSINVLLVGMLQPLVTD